MLKVRGKHYLNGEICDLLISDGKIQTICKSGSSGVDIGDEECWIAPGLIDIHINGFGGYDCDAGDGSGDNIIDLTEKLLDSGITAYCPTVTTRSPVETEAALLAIASACNHSTLAREHILGIHLEGPYISPEDGPRGAHPIEYVRDPDWDEFQHWQDISGGRIRIVTIAPERPNAIEFIKKSIKWGIVVAIGHTSATREQIEAAVTAGASLSTHLGNGAHAQLPRHNNYIWEQMANDALSATIIVDGHHLPSAVVKSIVRTKGIERLILISDAIWCAGLPPDTYNFMGASIEMGSDGSVRLTGTPFLAGSTLRLCDAITNVMRLAGISFSDAVVMATQNPARLLGVSHDRGHLREKSHAEITIFRPMQAGPQFFATIIGDKVCYAK